MLRLMVYDRSCTRHGVFPLGLSHAWGAGGPLYASLGRLHAWRGVDTWSDALRWLATVRPEEPIGEVQFWGHGRWGRALVRGESLDATALQASHPLHGSLAAVRARLTERSRWWFRTCETLGAAPGHDFARRWTGFMGCPVAGHTYIIGMLQSGLHELVPGAEPHWSPWEGLREGTPEAPTRAFWSRWGAPNTISFLHSEVPEGW